MRNIDWAGANTFAFEHLGHRYVVRYFPVADTQNRGLCVFVEDETSGWLPLVRYTPGVLIPPMVDDEWMRAGGFVDSPFDRAHPGLMKRVLTGYYHKEESSLPPSFEPDHIDYRHAMRWL